MTPGPKIYSPPKYPQDLNVNNILSLRFHPSKNRPPKIFQQQFTFPKIFVHIHPPMIQKKQTKNRKHPPQHIRFHVFFFRSWEFLELLRQSPGGPASVEHDTCLTSKKQRKDLKFSRNMGVFLVELVEDVSMI